MTKHQEAIEHLTATLRTVADSLEEVVTGMLGENAAYSIHAGYPEPPVEHFGKGHPAIVTKTWEAREIVNTAIDWVDQEMDTQEGEEDELDF